MIGCNLFLVRIYPPVWRVIQWTLSGSVSLFVCVGRRWLRGKNVAEWRAVYTRIYGFGAEKSSEMSLFGDFQNAWLKRFPGCDLPLAWEEDVRANLAKHGQRVAELKEELEKESFYVEYLERLLADVETHRRSIVDKIVASQSLANDKKPDKNGDVEAESNDSASPAQNGGGPQKSCRRSNGFVEAENGDDSVSSSPSIETVVDDQVLKNGGGGSGSRASVIGGDESSRVGAANKGNNQAFVTVIEVNGYAVALTTADGDRRNSRLEKQRSEPERQNGDSEGWKGGLKDVCPDEKRQKSSLERQKDSLDKQKSELEDKKARLEKQKSDLERQKLSLDESSLERQRGSLERAKMSLEKQKDSLDEDGPEEDGKAPPHIYSSPAIKKKVPPKPPPKRQRRPFSASQGAAAGTSSEKPSASNPSRSSHTCTSPILPVEDKAILEANTPDWHPRAAKSESQPEDVKLSLPPKPKSWLVKSESLKSNSSDLGEETRSADSRRQLLAKVAKQQSAENPDSEGENYLTMLSDKSSEYDDQTLKSQASGYSSHSGGLSDGDRSGLTESPASALLDDGASADENDGDDSPLYTDYVNIDYFLKKAARSKHAATLSRSESVAVDSDEDDDDGMNLILQTFVQKIELERKAERQQEAPNPEGPPAGEDVYDGDSGVYSSSVESTSFLCPSTPPPAPVTDSTRSQSQTPNPEESLAIASEDNSAEIERETMVRCIFKSILESETIYLDCLSVLSQYQKALKSAIGTSQFVISQEDLSTIFYKIEDLLAIHKAFFDGIRSYIQQWDGKSVIGDHFKILASRLSVYASFLKNYPLAIEVIRKCSSENAKFSDITKSIKLKAMQQTVSLEDLLHKPVDRVQKNALVLHDLLKYTPKSHPDFKALQSALRMTQSFLNEFNITATESMFPSHDRTQRFLVKNTFIIELSEGRRKLRHLFLFNDVIVCAKYRATGRDKFGYDAKWYIPLHDVVLPMEDDLSNDVKELSPVSVLALKSQLSSVRDLIMKDEYASKGKSRISGRNVDKHRKKLAELQAQLMLASPSLVFRIGQKNGKMYTFFQSSKFERSEWTDSIIAVQASAPATHPNLSLYELHSWITACHKFLQTNMGSFLLRSGKEDDIYVGDLHVQLHSLQGLTKPADMFFCLEIDSCGHFFRKVTTKVFNSTCFEPLWSQEFIMELEGSQMMRVLCYEQLPGEQTVLRGKTIIELHKCGVTSRFQEKVVCLQELTLTLSMKFSMCEMSLRRIPSAKPCGIFGMKLSTVLKKEKRDIPFLISCCVREVEKRGLQELGIYRVSGSSSDLQKIRKSFESNPYEAQQLVKEVDIHSVTCILKLYLRELPEGLFTDELYTKFIDSCKLTDPDARDKVLLTLFNELPETNKKIVNYLIDHMVKIIKEEAENKMSLQNVATVFGPTLLRMSAKSESGSMSEKLAAGTIDVMTQAKILHFFLKKRTLGEPIEFSSSTLPTP